MPLTKFTVEMFMRSAYGNASDALFLAKKCADFYRPKVKENKIARSRYLSAITCAFVLGLKIK